MAANKISWFNEKYCDTLAKTRYVLIIEMRALHVEIYALSEVHPPFSFKSRC